MPAKALSGAVGLVIIFLPIIIFLAIAFALIGFLGKEKFRQWRGERKLLKQVRRLFKYLKRDEASSWLEMKEEIIRGTVDKKIPITPFEVSRRMKDIPKILEWSKRKHLTVSGPDFWGIHHIYIDNFLKHIIFCLKADLTTHVFIGTPIGAKEWRKYDENVNPLFFKQVNSNSLEWKIYKDVILYKGKTLPPKRIPEEPYWGRVVGVETFNDSINDQWIVSRIKELYKKKS